MNLSAHNIISQTENRQYFVYNLLTGHADILEIPEYEALLAVNTNHELSETFKEKGYWSETGEENRLYRKAYMDFLDNRDKEEIQVFYVPAYHCNFSCSYCYQQEYSRPVIEKQTEIIPAFFDYLKHQFGNRRKYITLFGGEPLLPGTRNKEVIARFSEKCRENDLELAVVTNGYLLNEYLDILQKARIREIQVTLDGTDEVHNQRRKLNNGQETFNEIVQGIDQALERKIPVNLRVVVDKENINNLPHLARYAINKGWTGNPLFKTQLGRNYELHTCSQNSAKLFSRIGLWKEVYALLKKYPHIEDFHKPAFSVSRFLSENGTLPDPLFDACPGTKTEWAFDYTGHIYSCTATVGKKDESLGTFYPEVSLNEDKISDWEERDVLNIEKCKSCHLQLACGGGCGSVAKNNHGQINAPDCRPVKELLELGTNYYFQ